MPVAAKASQAGLPLLIHAGFAAHGDFMPLVHEIPGLKLILAHAGFPAYADTWPVIQDYKNVYVDLSADAYVDGKVSQQAVDFLGFSARACHSVVRVARTIADLENMSQIERHHIAEAIQFRSFDRGLS